VDSIRPLRFTDGGITWTTALRINRLAGDCVDEDNTVEGAVPAVGPNGEIYVAWAGPLVFNSQFKLFFDKSTDGGNTWLGNDLIVADQIGGWDYLVSGIYRCNGLPITCCDVSNGSYRGTIYVNWTDGTSGDHDVKISKSTNGGLNWSAPVRVNDDPAGKEQFFSWMTIDQAMGYIYIVFYDRRNYTDDQTDVYLARSTNGGTSFINERISASPFTPNSGTFFGDYNNITAHNGKIRPMWTRLVSPNSLSVWTAIIDIPIGIGQKENQIPSVYNLKQNYPNPFNPTTKVEYALPEDSYVTIKVHDILGKEIATLVNNNEKAGEHYVYWNAAELPSGVYYYSLFTKSSNDATNSLSVTKKMILLK
jgi:type IX secretion system substrate protein